ncbi:MAG: 4-hydroxy-3-methylbut-2-enyl diphosphate reductase [Candidatus Aminicenantes bacterium]|nr:4-hydroxy-3-methylbut-2-enyl diphosphate reductase [Candidatus Aminicenantes bacterium]
MKILVAEEAGFCFGVKRALKLINEYLKNGNTIQTFGPLIHNIPVLNNLAAQGVHSVDSVRNIKKNKTLCIRTHGIPRHVEKYIQKKGISTLDATCPLVKKEQKIIEKLDKNKGRIVIVGDKDHPEIIAARSYARKVTIVNSLAEAEALPACAQMSVVAQTTLNSEFFKQVVAILLDKAEKIEIFNTICQATQDRQQAVKKLAPQVDAIIVIGSKISSNTKKLFHIAKEKNKNSLHIETCADLQKPAIMAKIAKYSSIGVTAGASTAPEELERVKNFLQNL